MPVVHVYRQALAALIVCAIGAADGNLHAQGSIARAMTQQDRSEVQHYTLTEDTYQKLFATAKDAKANKIPIDIVDPNAHSLHDTAAHLERSADFRRLMQRHGLDAHTFLLGEYALLSAEFAVKYAGQPTFDSSLANPANIALYRRHEAELDALSGEDINN